MAKSPVFATAMAAEGDFFESILLTSFIDLGLAEPILRAIADEGYINPTPIQAQFIPPMMAGRDIVGIAQTGTGKTAAFTLPLLHKLVANKKRPSHKSCGTLILAPTRELAIQIADNIRNYGQFMHFSVAVVVGGAKPKPQIKALSRGVDIVVATPGRLEDHVSTGAMRLDSTSVVILDEADQMMDLGFMPAIRRIMKAVPRERQTLLLSATMPPKIRAMARDFLTNPVEVAVAQQAQPISRITQKVFFVDRPAKRRQLEDLLEIDDVDRAIIFTRTKHGANKVVLNLQKKGYEAAAIHGNKSQSQRQRTLNAFRVGELNLLVATDIAARGIDIDDVTHVINYELPNVPEAYVHRIGRTARAGKSGVAISLCDQSERGYLRDIEKLIGRTVDKEQSTVSEVTAADQADAADAEARERRAPGRGGPRRQGKPGGGNKANGNFRGKPKSSNGDAKKSANGNGKPKFNGEKTNNGAKKTYGANKTNPHGDGGQGGRTKPRNAQNRSGQNNNNQKPGHRGKPRAA